MSAKLSVVSGTSDSTIASVFRNAFAPISFLQFPRVELLQATKRLIEEQSQADPKFQTNKIFIRITGNALRKALSEQQIQRRK